MFDRIRSILYNACSLYPISELFMIPYNGIKDIKNLQIAWGGDPEKRYREVL